MASETIWLYSALGLYFAAAIVAVAVATARRSAPRWPMAVLVLALGVHSFAILLRWQRLDHGPYVNLFEVLSSNVWSLHVAVLLACLFFRQIRPMLALILPLLQVLVLWLASVAPSDVEAPVTYATVWLAVHVWLGKVFFGCVVVAVGLSLVILLRRWRNGSAFATMPPNAALNELIYRLILVAFIFESLMLVAGAVWAQDAWGRYWAWDPLETWAFLTWLAVVGFLHLRTTWRPSPAVSSLAVIAIFVIAFSTFFGMPFISTAPHKGAI